MKRVITGAVFFALFWAVISQFSILFAQSTAITYQGVVTDKGTNFNGTGLFQFALVTGTNTSSQASANAVLTGTSVTSYSVTSGGNGYMIAPAVHVTGGGGSGATATAVISGGVVTSINPGSAGTGYTSAPTVTIDPPPANIAYTTYWSNDGTSSAGSEPSASVAVPVKNGLFTVALGDSSLGNMVAIPVAIFEQQSNVQLRVWFNDGVNGFAALSPAANLSPTAYAVQALNAANASQLTGTLPLAQLPPGVVTNGAAALTLSGSFSGNGAGLTNLSATSLPPSVLTNNALLSGGNTFSGNQVVKTGYVGIGTTTPQNPLDVHGMADFFNDVGIGTQNPANLLDVRGWADFMGNVGIGTSFPLNALDVHGSGTFSGSVGIGTTIPVNPLDVHGPADFIGNVGIGVYGADSPLSVGGYIHILGNGQLQVDLTNGVAGFFGNFQNYNGTEFGVSKAAYEYLAFNTSSGNSYFPNGRVGIGTSSPAHALLDVEGSSDSYTVNPGAVNMYYNYAGVAYVGAGTRSDASIYASSSIVSGGNILCNSDARIKNIRGRSNAAEDLKTLLGIEITDYTYKDVIAHGNHPEKKAIAQQVEKVFPQAVTQGTNEVPDIYTMASVRDGWVQLATNLKVGERVKLIGETQQGIYPVLEVSHGAFRTAFAPTSGKVFVYGRQVDDFRTVDYQAISMLNVSATQELASKVEASEESNRKLALDNAMLKAQMTDLQAQLEKLQKTVAQLAAKPAGLALNSGRNEEK